MRKSRTPLPGQGEFGFMAGGDSPLCPRGCDTPTRPQACFSQSTLWRCDGCDVLFETYQERPTRDERPVMPFGKYAGVPLEEINPRYLHWILLNVSDLSEPIPAGALR
jgi:hypothetical protein